MKHLNMKLHLKDMIDLEIGQEKEFAELLKEEKAIGNKPIKVIDVLKKFLLKKLTKQQHTIRAIGSSVPLIIIIVLVSICLAKRLRWNKTVEKQIPLTIIDKFRADYTTNSMDSGLTDITSILNTEGSEHISNQAVNMNPQEEETSKLKSYRC